MRREKIVWLHKKGVKLMQIVTIIGLRYLAVRRVVDLYAQSDWPVIRPPLRRRASGGGLVLGAGQEEHTHCTIIDKRPARWNFVDGAVLPYGCVSNNSMASNYQCTLWADTSGAAVLRRKNSPRKLTSSARKRSKLGSGRTLLAIQTQAKPKQGAPLWR